jgi:methyl-accepting chemotaxis protein
MTFKVHAPRWVARMTIGSRLTAAFSIVLALTALLGAAAVFSLARVNQSATELADKWLPSVSHTNAARTAILEFRELEVKHARAADASYRTEYEDKMKESGIKVAKQLDAYAKLPQDGDEAKLAGQFQARWADYQKQARRVIEMGNAGKTDDAKDVGDGAAKMAADDAVSALDAVTAFNFEGGQKTAERAALVYDLARAGTLALVLVALTVGVLLSWLIARALRQQLGGDPAVATQVARAVADGDLSTPIPLRVGDTTSLMASLQVMQSSLSRVVSSVREGSQNVASASGEIAQGNTDLSARTEEQAADLQQASSSMEQLGATVKQNADNALEADALAKRASDVARSGGEAVSRVVQTMSGINESSRRIADIIGTIDGIAFQTNILALNAAVEAARAGEQGRGFAVVASEVRNLAQRSADAAREIKTLISASVERVEQGASQVNEAGATMKEVVASISRVTEIMSEISEASREQSAGVALVGQAVTQMDTATQRNAALVEESAAAAESLRLQAADLVQVVAAFKLAH